MAEVTNINLARKNRGTLSHIIWRLKYEIMLNWKGLDPSQARVLEMATTYM